MRCHNSNGGYYQFAGVREGPLNRETVHCGPRHRHRDSNRGLPTYGFGACGDFTAPERKFDEAESSLPEEADAFPNTGPEAAVLQIRVALTEEFKTVRTRDYSH
jgi:hypothetical protein